MLQLIYIYFCQYYDYFFLDPQLWVVYSFKHIMPRISLHFQYSDSRKPVSDHAFFSNDRIKVLKNIFVLSNDNNTFESHSPN